MCDDRGKKGKLQILHVTKICNLIFPLTFVTHTLRSCFGLAPRLAITFGWDIYIEKDLFRNPEEVFFGGS